MPRRDNSRPQRRSHKLASRIKMYTFGFKEALSMKNRYRYSALLSVVVVACCATLFLSRHVSAAGEGKITGTVKLDGAAPHMKGIDMSKDPYCSKAHANDTPHLESVVAGAS